MTVGMHRLQDSVSVSLYACIKGMGGGDQDYAFQRQSNENPSIMLGCPGMHASTLAPQGIHPTQLYST